MSDKRTWEGLLILCNVDDVYQYVERWLHLYYEVIMQPSSTIGDVYLFFVDMQIWALLKRTQFIVSKWPTRPKDISLLSLGNLFIFHWCRSLLNRILKMRTNNLYIIFTIFYIPTFLLNLQNICLHNSSREKYCYYEKEI